MNIAKDEYHGGFKFEHDLSNFTELFAQLALKNDKGDFFLRGDLLKKEVTLGCNHTHKGSQEQPARHSVELHADTTQEKKGLFGQPIWLRWAGQYPMANGGELRMAVDYSDKVDMKGSYSQEIDKNLKIVACDSVSTESLFAPDFSKLTYNFGIKMQYSL